MIDGGKETLGFQQAQKKKEKKATDHFIKGTEFSLLQIPLAVHRGPVGIEVTWLLGWRWGG